MIRAKKSLGKNFLIDNNLIEKIVNATNIKGENILEIGPGTGNLTSAILKKEPNKLIVVEKDDRLAEELKLKFHEKIRVINDDILELNEKKITEEELTVFGNLPYNISTEILCKWILNLEDQYWFKYLILMFQKEVADRIIGEFNSKNYSRLSIISQWRLDVEKICDIKPTSFSPKPKINSSLIFFKPKKNFFQFKDSKSLEKITRIFFMHKRKMIKKPYNQIFNGDNHVAEKLKIDLNLRPQNLNFETFYNITKEYENLRS